MEAKKQGSGEEDLSMEEILQSIRRIIADDGDEAKPAAALPSSGGGATEPTSSDVLELTDMLPEETAALAPTDNGDILGKIDAALAPTKAETAPIETPDTVAIAMPEIIAEPKSAQDNIDALLSSSAEAETLAALSKLKIPEPETPVYTTTPSPTFRSGSTVEDMVEELLRPMMKTWLDNNLPAIVERIVEREVQRLTRR